MGESEKRAVLDFYRRVCARAEGKMMARGKLEGSHYAAMREEIAVMGFYPDAPHVRPQPTPDEG